MLRQHSHLVTAMKQVCIYDNLFNCIYLTVNISIHSVTAAPYDLFQIHFQYKKLFCIWKPRDNEPEWLLNNSLWIKANKNIKKKF